MTRTATKDLMTKLKALDDAARELRQELELDQPGEVVWSGETYESQIIVEADGYGAATVREVEGNYPVDFYVRREQTCNTVDKACKIAAKWHGDFSGEEVA